MQTRYGVAEVVGREAMSGQALKAYIEGVCAGTPGVEVSLEQLDALPSAREARGRAMSKAGEHYPFQSVVGADTVLDPGSEWLVLLTCRFMCR